MRVIGPASMDGFNIIQHFFTRMRCNNCSCHLEPEGIELIRHDNDVYIVNVHCIHCSRQMGIAMVGMDGAELADRPKRRYKDPELTPAELTRLASYNPIDYDDVLDAHGFFNSLGPDWQKYLPSAETLLSEIPTEPESEAS